MTYANSVFDTSKKTTSTSKTPVVNSVFTPKTPTSTTKPVINSGLTTKPTGKISQPASYTPNAVFKPSTSPSKPSAPLINPGLTTKPVVASPSGGSSYSPPILFHDTPSSSGYTAPTQSGGGGYGGGGGYSGGGGGYSAPATAATPTTATDAVASVPNGEETRPLVLTPEQEQSQSQAINTVDSVMSGYQQLAQDAKNMGNEGLIALAAQWDKMSSTLDAVEAQITDQIKGQMSADDPAMQSAISLIRQEADKMRKETLDELNSRGLVQSGVYAKALSDMNNTELTQVQTAVASRFGDLQTQLNNAIISMAQTRISALGANQTAVASMMTNTQNNVSQIGLSGLNSSVTMRGQDIQDSQADAALTQNQNQYNSTLGYNRDQTALQSQQFYDQLSQANKQFYDQLSSNEKLAYASQAASRGSGSATSSLAAQKFAFEQQQYQEGKTAGEQSNTWTQVGMATGSGGLVEQAISGISKGKATVGQYQTLLANGGYTPEAQKAILGYIQADPSVQKKTSTPAKKTTKSSTYTPSGLSGGFMYK